VALIEKIEEELQQRQAEVQLMTAREKYEVGRRVEITAKRSQYRRQDAVVRKRRSQRREGMQRLQRYKGKVSEGAYDFSHGGGTGIDAVPLSEEMEGIIGSEEMEDARWVESQLAEDQADDEDEGDEVEGDEEGTGTRASRHPKRRQRAVNTGAASASASASAAVSDAGPAAKRARGRRGANEAVPEVPPPNHKPKAKNEAVCPNCSFVYGKRHRCFLPPMHKPKQKGEDDEEEDEDMS